MKPEMSTAVMIERLRALASEGQDGVLLSSAVSRIELLLAAESGMSREMACIRHALDIPPDQSVQSGVVDAFVRLNAKIQDLSAQLAEMRGQAGTPFAWANLRDGDPTFPRVLMDEDSADWMVEKSTVNPPVTKIPLYTRPVPPAASPHAINEWADVATKALQFLRNLRDGVSSVDAAIESVEWGVAHAYSVAEREKVTYAPTQAASQHVPDEIPETPDADAEVDAYNKGKTDGWNACRAAMLQLSGNSPVSSALVAENLALKEIIDRITDLDNEPQYHESGMGCGLEDRNITDRYEAMRHGWDAAMERVYGEVIPCAEELSFPATEQAARELMAKGVDQAASGFHEKAFVAFEGSNEPGLYIRAQLQLLAQQLRDGDA